MFDTSFKLFSKGLSFFSLPVLLGPTDGPRVVFAMPEREHCWNRRAIIEEHHLIVDSYVKDIRNLLA
jgi:hypothetical protein